MVQRKKCYIFAGSPDADCSDITFDKERYVICADGGYSVAKKADVKPDVIIGDFDSFTEIPPKDCEIIRHPSDKDDTDTMLAVKLAMERGYNNIVICGGIGGRLDHTFANIQTLRYIMKNGGNGELAGNGSIAMMQGPGVKVYNRISGCYFSLFSFTEECTGITATGFKYPMKNATLKSSFPLGVSNRVVGKSGVISLEKGVLLVIFSKDMNQNR